MRRVNLFALIFLILVTPISIAVGTSTLDSSGSNTDTSTDTNTRTADAVQVRSDVLRVKARLAACDSDSTRRDRIECRLQVRVQERDYYRDYESDEAFSDRIPEACKRLAQTDIAAGNDSRIRFTRARCSQFHLDVRPCYEQEGRQKLMCFRRVAGLGTAAVSGNSDKENVRSYVVALLYDLQGRLENAVDSGNLDAESAAEVIDLIVEIKEKILNGERRAEIIPLLRELRVKLQDLKQELGENE